jgi:hypothetical protein
VLSLIGKFQKCAVHFHPMRKIKGLLNDITKAYPSVQTIVHSKWLMVNGRMEEIQEGEGHHQCYRTEQLRKLGRLESYYLDQFNQSGVFICRKREGTKQRCSRNHGERDLSGCLYSLGNVQFTMVKLSIMLQSVLA